jgi:hypothetical protein
VNTYGRLALFYGPGFLFRVENAPEGGARVKIGAARGARPAAGSG